MEFCEDWRRWTPGRKVLPGEVAFKLHDTYGFPLDLTPTYCRERDVTGGRGGLRRRHGGAKAAGPRGWQVQDGQGAGIQRRANQFTGYDELGNCKVVARSTRWDKRWPKNGESGVVVLDTTPFYAESGGQVGDRRRRDVAGEGGVCGGDTQKIKADVFGHHGVLERAR